MNDSWRYIDEGENSAFYNMALDEAIATAVRKELSPPTLRLYGWDRSSVTIGCFQKSSDIDNVYCKSMGIPVVRRPTGGRGILHGNELTYSFSANTDAGLFSHGLIDSYRKISEAFGLAFTKLGIVPEIKLTRKICGGSEKGQPPRTPLCFHSVSYGEISLNKRKIVGAAQKRWRDGLLQQGSVPVRISYDEVFMIFQCSDTQRIQETMCGLGEIGISFTMERLKNALRAAFEEVFAIQFDSALPSAEEIHLAEELKAKKYSTYQWNFQR
jgi:lipoyl(octanoyl) transferase